MVLKKNKTLNDDSGLSKNNGRDVKYRIRKQEEKEADELLKQYLDLPEDEVSGNEDLPGRPL